MAHGGDIYTNDICMDYSVNVNPFGVPEIIDDIFRKYDSYICSYPDYESFELRNMLAARYCLSVDNVLCSNGASEIFMAMAHAFRPENVLLTAPSFAGYVWAFEAVEANLIYYVTKEENDFLIREDIMDVIDEKDNIDMLILANPSNPVGNYTDNNLLDKLLKECKKRDIAVIIDECFMELSDICQNTKTDLINSYDNLFIVRAFTKTFAIPALRLGYVLGSNVGLMMKIRRQLPEWNVSLPAQKAGAVLMSEESKLETYLAESRKLINKERSYLMEELSGMGIKVYPSFTNFILLKTDILLYNKLLDKKILIRDCSDYYGLDKGYYRIAIKKHVENEVLIDAIKELLR